MLHSHSGKNITFPDQADGLHQQGKDQREAVADWVFQGEEVRHVPHQEQDAKSADGGFTCCAWQFIRVDKSTREKDEDERGLQVPCNDNADQQAGDPRANCDIVHRILFPFSFKGNNISQYKNCEGPPRSFY